MKKFKLLHVILNLFEGGAAGAGAGAAAAGEGSAQGGTNGTPGNTLPGTSGEAKVVYGKQEPAAQDPAKETPAAGEKKPEEKPAPTREERRKAYDAFIAENKEFYTEDTQKMINRRFKDSKTTEDELGRMKPLIDQMCQRYHIADGDVEKLQAAMDADTSYLEEEAEANGMSPEAYGRYLKMQRENKAMADAMTQRQNQQAAQRTFDGWMAEAQEMTGKYPGFNLEAETANPNFIRMLQSGVPMETAYKVLHMDEIVETSAREAAKTREEQLAASIRTQGKRPPEAGASSQVAFTVKDDVSKLTREDRANIVRQVAAGKTIKF